MNSISSVEINDDVDREEYMIEEFRSEDK